MRVPAFGASAPPMVSSVSSVSDASTVMPSACNALIIRSVSRLRSAPETVDEPLARREDDADVPCGAASAARISARLVWDFEPGTVTVAWTGVAVDGAGQLLTASILACRDFLPPWGSCADDSR